MRVHFTIFTTYHMFVFTLRRTALLTLVCCFGTALFSQQRPAKLDIQAIRNVERSLRLPLTLPDAKRLEVNLQETDYLGATIKRQFPDLHIYRVTSGGVTGVITTDGERLLGDVQVGGRWLQTTDTDANGNFLLTAAGKDTPAVAPVICGNESEAKGPWIPTTKLPTKAIGAPLTSGATARTYRLNVITTGEFYQENGNNDDDVILLAAQTVAFTNLVFNNDLAVTLSLETLLMRRDSTTDEFIPDLASGAPRAQQAGQAANAAFSPGTYDLSMVFHNTAGNDNWRSGGVAGLEAVCNKEVYSDESIRKGYGWSGSANNGGIGWRRLVTHELGHMFGASHTFNGAGSSCTAGAQASGYSVEIGSGSTIMSYAGICDPAQNVPHDRVTSSYFHQVSVEQMLNIVRLESDCAQTDETGNALPVVNASPCTDEEFTIPLSTPFRLEGSATDDNPNDQLTYTWEQVDEDGATSNPTQGATGSQPNRDGLTADQLVDAPLFLSVPPGRETFRNFPDNRLGRSTDFEVLPGVARTMTFGLVVRDNHIGGGGIATDLTTVNVSADGPLVFTGPATSAALSAGSAYTFEWNTNGSDALCAAVTVQMSTDGGDTYPYSLNEPGEVGYGDGEATLSIPTSAPGSDNVRFRLVCSDNPCRAFYAIDQELRTLTNQDCATASTRITPVDALTTTAGDPSANLDLSANLGEESNLRPSSSLSRQSAEFVDRMYYSADARGSTCTSVDAALPIDRYTIVPTDDGIIAISATTNNFATINLYEDNFEAEDACATWLASNLYRNGVDGDWTRRSLSGVVIKAGRRYIITVTPFIFSYNDGDVTEYELNINVPSNNVLFDNYALPEDYVYSFTAIDQSNDRVAAVSKEADFTGLNEGDYRVYGVTYSETVNTSLWVGQTLSRVVSGGDDQGCVQLSDNSRPLTIQGNQVAAPVEWLSFTGAVDASSRAELRWSVAAEVDNDYFTVSRSDDGQAWQPIGQVSGRGTDPTYGSYVFADPTPLGGPTYYRLTQVDYDGSFDYSEIVRLDAGADGALAVYPNPFTSEVRVTTAVASTELPTLHDIHGRQVGYQVSMVRESDRIIRLGMSSLPTGIYLLHHTGTTVRLIKR